MKIAAYEIESIGTSITFTKYCGVSDLTQIVSNTESTHNNTTFRFSNGIDCAPTASYAFAFVTDSASATTLSAATSMSSSASSDHQGITLWHTQGGTLAGAEYLANGKWETDKNPLASYSITATKEDAVPEPATATLSLLALAGLAARRRESKSLAFAAALLVSSFSPGGAVLEAPAAVRGRSFGVPGGPLLHSAVILIASRAKTH